MSLATHSLTHSLTFFWLPQVSRMIFPPTFMFSMVLIALLASSWLSNSTKPNTLPGVIRTFKRVDGVRQRGRTDGRGGVRHHDPKIHLVENRCSLLSLQIEYCNQDTPIRLHDHLLSKEQFLEAWLEAFITRRILPWANPQKHLKQIKK